MSEIQQAEVIELEFPHCVRIRPGMYLPHITHMITEIADNSLDEYTSGYATGIAVYIQDEIITVLDNGRGIPVAPSKKNPNISQVEIAAATLHGGGKFNVEDDGKGGFKSKENGIKTTGLHGVGLSVVNALSEWLVIRVKTGGKKYEIAFQQGIKAQDLTIIEEGLDPADTGTEVIFKPDRTIWKEDDIINVNDVASRLKTLAYLNPGLMNYLYVSEGDEVKLEETYQFDEGIRELVESKVNGKTKIVDTFTIQGEHNGVEVYVGMTYTDTYDTEHILSFCNNAATTEHGDHVTGLKTAITKVVTDCINERKLNIKFDSSDALEGLTAIVSIRVQDPFFDGQGKAKIKMTSVRQAVKKIVEENLAELFDHNPAIAKALVDKVANASKARLAAQKAREAVRKIKENSDNPTGLAGKLSNCTSRKAEECEIYIVEGDSAGGSAKQARDRYFQAILPIFGKPLNVEKKRLHDVVKNERLMDLVRACGCGLGEEFDISKLKYHKIIIMSDADVDGSHIKTLWLTYIYRYMKPLIENGYMYFSCPPLYKLVINKQNYFAKDEQERDALIAQYGNKVTNVQRFKGLGEMNPEELWETTMNPATRTLEQITIDDIEKDEYMLSLCMGEEVIPRREFIMQHALEANIDC
jgi:DNA gyrase subunit B